MKKNLVYEKIVEFKKKYPMTVAWRLKKHAKIVDMHLNPGEEVLYAFAASVINTPSNAIATSISTKVKPLLFDFFILLLLSSLIIIFIKIFLKYK